MSDFVGIYFILPLSKKIQEFLCAPRRFDSRLDELTAGKTRGQRDQRLEIVNLSEVYGKTVFS